MSDAAALSPLDRLLLEMEEGGDFPALSRTIGEINRAIGDENSRANLLTDIILRDIALALRNAFRIPLGFAPDVFHAATAKGQDILISDTTADNIRTRIPDWYLQAVRAHSFLLLPVMVEGKPLALLYADRIDAPLQLSNQALGLIKALRNQTALALRQKL